MEARAVSPGAKKALRVGTYREATPPQRGGMGYTRDELRPLSINELRAAKARELSASQMAEAETSAILFETGVVTRR